MSKRLAVVKTPTFTLTIKGRFPRKTLLLNRDVDAKLSLEHQILKAEFYSPVEDTLVPFDNQEEVWFPLFFEETPYEIIIEARDDIQNINFYHPREEIRSAVSPTIEGGKTLSGVINFGSEVGYTKFSVKRGSRPLLNLELEVFPKKLDYKEDFWLMIEEVTEEIYNLAFDLLKKSYFPGRVTVPPAPRAEVEWLSILKRVFENLMNAIDRIERQPHRAVVRTQKLRQASLVRRTPKEIRRWITKHPQEIKKTQEQDFIFQYNGEKFTALKLPESRKVLSFDNYENRFVKWGLNQILLKLRTLESTFSWNKESSRAIHLRRILRKFEREIRKRLNYDFLSEVGDLERQNFSLVLQFGPGYREFFRNFLRLKKGLEIEGHFLNLSLKDVAKLYEYWCFIKLCKILRDKKDYRLITQNLVEATYSGISVKLKKGRESSVEFLSPDDEKMVIYYNRRFESPTLRQIPDNVIWFQREGFTEPFQYFLDAKYRIEREEESTLPIPKKETINEMHRYRDSIVTEAEREGRLYNRMMFGGIVLFPSSQGEEFRSHLYHRSLERVNIGALPFLPTTTCLVEEFLDGLLTQSGEAIFDQAIEYSKRDRARRKEEQRKIVLVGVVKHGKKQMKLIRQGFYHIPGDQVNRNRFQADYLAFFESKRSDDDYGKIRYYAKVKDIKIVKGEKLKSQGATWIRNPKKIYVKYKIGDLKELEKPILNKERWTTKRADRITFRYGTLYSLQRAEIIPELYIISETDRRLWDELKAADKKFDVRKIEGRITPFRSPKVEFLVKGKRGQIVKITFNEAKRKYRIEYGDRQRPVYASYHDLKFNTDEFLNLLMK